ncbi:MAG: 4-hydroxy-3-methylbut-2-enyl diphosphate reductase [Erysipelotrichia bacterium]|jgi:4-hydroxy-3-methylbut-2-enyl diphosphate reductase|nr:4-hydroxy-3-methylbut-2-enyl diphosphate reductase [Erysipelotrichia bacterium]
MIKHMNVFVANPHGYCTGVVRAIELVKRVRESHQTGDVFVLGSIVHNEDVINELTMLGITTLRDKSKTPSQILRELPERSIIVFTAHGHDTALEQIVKEKMMIAYDATCPMVNTNHHIIKNELKNSHQVIYIGKKNHPEAMAAASISNDVILIEKIENLDLDIIQDSSPLVINQTTLSHLELRALHETIVKLIPRARLADEICSATLLRQNAVLKLPRETQLVYVVGGENSSNTASLVKIASKHLPFARIIRILNEREINKKDLIGLEYVAVVSGASTPLETTNRVVELLKKL